MHFNQPRTRFGRLALAGSAALALALLPALPAAAHDQLTDATPAAGAVITTPPSAVDLTFSASLLELGGGRNGIRVTGAGGRHFETACARVAGPRLSVPVALGGAGAYTVAWQAVSSDGHLVGATYTFDYRPAAGAVAAAGSATSPCATAPRDTAAAASSGAPVAVLVGAIGGGLVLVLVAVVLVVVLRGRRGADEEHDEEAPEQASEDADR